MKGRQVILRAYGQPFEIQEYDVPDPGPGDIVLRITQAGICGSDLHTWRGDTENNPVPPQGRAMGHEGTGVVYKLGQGVTTDALGSPLHEGDRVIHTAILPCQHCRVSSPTLSAPLLTTTTSPRASPYSRSRTNSLMRSSAR